MEANITFFLNLQNTEGGDYRVYNDSLLNAPKPKPKPNPSNFEGAAKKVKDYTDKIDRILSGQYGGVFETNVQKAKQLWDEGKKFIDDFAAEAKSNPDNVSGEVLPINSPQAMNSYKNAIDFFMDYNPTKRSSGDEYEGSIFEQYVRESKTKSKVSTSQINSAFDDIVNHSGYSISGDDKLGYYIEKKGSTTPVNSTPFNSEQDARIHIAKNISLTTTSQDEKDIVAFFASK
jgi:hypothetical protein